MKKLFFAFTLLLCATASYGAADPTPAIRAMFRVEYFATNKIDGAASGVDTVAADAYTELKLLGIDGGDPEIIRHLRESLDAFVAMPPKPLKGQESLAKAVAAWRKK